MRCSPSLLRLSGLRLALFVSLLRHHGYGHVRGQRAVGDVLVVVVDVAVAVDVVDVVVVVWSFPIL